MDLSKIARDLKTGKVGVIPTETIYGIVGAALNPQTVGRIYKLRKRNLDKPFIILISQVQDTKQFGIKLPQKISDQLNKSWPKKTSIIFPCHSKKFSYLHRDQNSLAFRIPHQKSLLKLIKSTGPLVAPSANPQGQSPAQTILQAQKYFGQSVDFYIDGGELKSKPSTILQLDGENFITLRK